MKHTDKYYMKQALKEAYKAYVEGEVPVGAVIVVDNKIVARGHNNRENTQHIFGHAEMVVLNKLNKKYKSWRFPDAEIYVTVEPCIMCAGALVQSRLKRIIYGAKDFSGGALGSSINILDAKNINHHPEITSGVLEEECSQLIKKFFQERRKQNKDK